MKRKSSRSVPRVPTWRRIAVGALRLLGEIVGELLRLLARGWRAAPRWLKVVVVAVAIVFGLVTLAAHRTAWALFCYAAPPTHLTLPVEGVTRRGIHSSWGEPRSGHRNHQGIDIFGKRGTPVVAAAAGEVIRIGQDRLGGNVVWVAGEGARLYYYAHLQQFREGLHVGEQLRAGEMLGRVGNTGNARDTPPHLHFGVYPATRFFRPVDPAELLLE
jgi:murein DD-endopeptidase MepM/ murein hydrolase activator NlpD